MPRDTARRGYRGPLMGDVGTAPALSFDGVSMVFPDGTHALRETTFDVRARRVRHGRRAVRMWQEHAAADRLRA